MTIISLNFFIFFLLMMVVYFILPGKVQWFWLFLGSLYFYYMISTIPQFIIFIAIILINWLAAKLISDENRYRRVIYLSALIFDILSLVLFKYCEFFVEIITGFSSAITGEKQTDLLQGLIQFSDQYAPLRISYFGLIIIGYLTDVYWGKFSAQNNPLKLVLFTGYFPQMTSGPIVSYEQMSVRLWGEKHKFSYIRTVSGLERVIWGIFKKLVISERCSVIVNTIYEHYFVYSGLYIPLAASFFALQLYTDFSGLMDIVLGISEILGIELPENFDTPFYSTTLSEFWRRWHITLGGFLRDYIMYPVQRSNTFRKMRKAFKKKFGKGYENRCNIPLFLALLISWFLIGLWHGGGWNYIFGVGLYMWIIIVLSDLLKPLFTKINEILRINTECFSFTLFRRVRTFFIFIFGLSFFRAPTLKDGFGLWKSAFSSFNPWILFDESLYNLGLDRREIGILLISILALFIVSTIKQKVNVREWLFEQNFIFRLAIFVVLFVVVISLGYYGSDYNAADFIYGRF